MGTYDTLNEIQCLNCGAYIIDENKDLDQFYDSLIDEGDSIITDCPYCGSFCEIGVDIEIEKNITYDVSTTTETPPDWEPETTDCPDQMFFDFYN